MLLPRIHSFARPSPSPHSLARPHSTLPRQGCSLLPPHLLTQGCITLRQGMPLGLSPFRPYLLPPHPPHLFMQGCIILRQGMPLGFSPFRPYLLSSRTLPTCSRRAASPSACRCFSCANDSCSSSSWGGKEQGGGGGSV